MNKFTAIINEHYQIGSHWSTLTSHVRMEQQTNETVEEMLVREKIDESVIFLFNGWPSLQGESNEQRTS